MCGSEPLSHVACTMRLCSAPEHDYVPLLGRHCAVALVCLPAVYSVKPSVSLTHNFHHSPYRKANFNGIRVRMSAALRLILINSVLCWLRKGGHLDGIASLSSLRMEPSTHSALARSPSAFHSDIIFRAFLAAFKVDPHHQHRFVLSREHLVHFRSGDYQRQ